MAGFYNVVENQRKNKKVDDTVREAFKVLKKELDSCGEGEENKENIMCVDDFNKRHSTTFKFNAEYLERAIKANMFYGGPEREINNMSNILFIKGDDDFWIDLGFSSTKFKDIIKNDDSITVLLKAGNIHEAQGDHASNVDAWNYILRTLKNWSGIEITEDQNEVREIEIEKEYTIANNNNTDSHQDKTCSSFSLQEQSTPIEISYDFSIQPNPHDVLTSKINMN